jgi:hypothetical protein
MWNFRFGPLYFASYTSPALDTMNLHTERPPGDRKVRTAKSRETALSEWTDSHPAKISHSK